MLAINIMGKIRINLNFFMLLLIYVWCSIIATITFNSNWYWLFQFTILIYSFNGSLLVKWLNNFTIISNYSMIYPRWTCVSVCEIFHNVWKFKVNIVNNFNLIFAYTWTATTTHTVLLNFLIHLKTGMSAVSNLVAKH